MSGCQLGSTRSARLISTISPIPETLLGECRDPVAIPHQALGQTQIAKLWGQDRQNLVDCRDDKRALNKAVRVQQKEDRSR